MLPNTTPIGCNNEVWYAIPSASVERCRANLPAWREKGYKIAVLQNRERGDIPADRLIWANEYPGWAASINQLCKTVVPADAPIVVTGGDDMLPDPNHTADELREQFISHFPDTFGIMQPVGDPYMNAHEYCGSPWLGRAWIDRAYNGHGPLHPNYRHNWADHELWWIATGLGVLWLRDDLVHHHHHFARAGQNPPDYWQHHVANNDERDVKNFLARRWHNFPGHQPLGWNATKGPASNSTDWYALQPDGIAEHHYLARYAGLDHAAQQLRNSLNSLAERGLARVAIYGSGTQLRLASQALVNPPVSIVAIHDDNTALIGTTLFNYTITPISSCKPDRLDAILIIARADPAHMLAKCTALQQQGVTVEAIAPGISDVAHVSRQNKIEYTAA